MDSSFHLNHFCVLAPLQLIPLWPMFLSSHLGSHWLSRIVSYPSWRPWVTHSLSCPWSLTLELLFHSTNFLEPKMKGQIPKESKWISGQTQQWAMCSFKSILSCYQSRMWFIPKEGSSQLHTTIRESLVQIQYCKELTKGIFPMDCALGRDAVFCPHVA
jgi:hypothetical protein